MQRYLDQLIADMKHEAKNLPQKPCYDIPPEAEGIEYVIEWENAIAKPMHEWTGIAKDRFPPSEKLTDQQLVAMVDEILKLWEAYNFYADLPANLPARIAYKVLVDSFDKPVSWISEGRTHIEFCDYEPDNCPFPDVFCMCKNIGEEADHKRLSISDESVSELAMTEKEINEMINDSEMEIPAKYRELVRNIAENNDVGFVCFVNPDTGEMEDAMPEWLEDPESLEDAADRDWEEMYTFEKWERVITIDPPESHESFRIMEDFTDYRVTGKLQQLLFDALSRPKPFRNFKNLIDQSEYRQQWFDYKQKRLEERAWTLMSKGLRE